MFPTSVSEDLQSSNPVIAEVGDAEAAARWDAICRRYAQCLARIAADPTWAEAELAAFDAQIWRWERHGYPHHRRARRRRAARPGRHGRRS